MFEIILTNAACVAAILYYKIIICILFFYYLPWVTSPNRTLGKLEIKYSYSWSSKKTNDYLPLHGLLKNIFYKGFEEINSKFITLSDS